MDLEGLDLNALQTALTPRLTKYIPYGPTPKQSAFLKKVSRCLKYAMYVTKIRNTSHGKLIHATSV